MIGHSRNGKLWLVVWFTISLCIILRVYVKIKMQQMQHRDSILCNMLKGAWKHIFKKDITVGWAGGVKTVFNSKWLESDTIGLLSAGGSYKLLVAHTSHEHNTGVNRGITMAVLYRGIPVAVLYRGITMAGVYTGVYPWQCYTGVYPWQCYTGV